MPNYDPIDERSEEPEGSSDSWVPKWWLDGYALRFYPEWTGRGIFLELGSRGYFALTGVR